jgi:hypothetical protein
MLNLLSINYIDMLKWFLLYNATPYIPEIIIYLLRYIGVRYYIINGDRETYKKIIKRLEMDTICTKYIYRCGKDLPAGYFIGNKCMGYYSRDSKFIEDESIYLLAYIDYYKYLCSEDCIKFVPELENEDETDSIIVKKKQKQTQEQVNDKIKVYMRHGGYKNIYYIPLSLDISHINPIGSQGPIVEDIIHIYKKKERATIFIHGVTCAGKSSIGYLLAKELKGHFCHTFKPTDPGDSFCNLIHELNGRGNEDLDAPLIIVLEEVNEIIGYIHNKSLKRHSEMPISVYDKSSWCNFLDDMIFYKNIILLLTSNESKELIDSIDPAYLREGRIDAVFSMSEKIDICNKR